MPKEEFMFGFIEGLFLGISLKTGQDVSETGVAITILNAFRELMPVNLWWFIPASIISLTVAGAILFYTKFKENPFFMGAGFVIGLLMVLLN
ncbi:MAG: hypothetical protein NUV67_03775 [archaeon]|nr:hypothetical protein [archaeon]